jgi:hypothetical protein
MSHGSHRREPLRTISRLASLTAGAALLVLLAYAIWDAVPNRTAVTLDVSGGRAMFAGRYSTAEHDFIKVLELEPRSLNARAGLACVYLLTGHKSRATLELTRGIEAGLAPGRLGHCGHGVTLDDVFISAKLGLFEAFAVPRGVAPKRYERALLRETTDSPGEESERLLIASCLAFRAGSDGAGWYYAASAHDGAGITPAGARSFYRCAGERVLRHLDCSGQTSFTACVLTPRLQRAYLDDRSHVFPPRQGYGV